jgi:hypothetical protein
MSVIKYAYKAAVLDEAIIEIRWRMKIQIYFTFMQHLKLAPTRTDRGLNFTALLQHKLHQGHK